jgi:TetR/AcrR family transcriptional repressor of nem operon
MGHSRAEKADTHTRIVNIASRKLREDGLAGIGVADVMEEAGLTVGGFYKHFDSRDALIREALAAACGAWQARADAADEGGPPISFKSLVDEYLSPRHRDNPGAGCPVAAVAAEVARGDARTRAQFSARLVQNINLLTGLIDAKDTRTACHKAIAAYAAMVGAIIMARVANDEAVSREILTAVADQLLRD